MNHVDPDMCRRAPAETRAAGAVFLDSARSRILEDFVAHLGRGTGPMFLVGEPGSGKTTLLRRVAEEAAAQQLPVLLAANGPTRFSPLVAMIAELEARATTFSSDPLAAIVVDDAEECPVVVWHKLIGLMRTHPQAPALPPLILALPLEMLIWLKELAPIEPETLDARVRRLGPLSQADVALFLGQRLAAAGHGAPECLSPQAIQRIAAASGGMPGRISRLCDDVVDFVRDGGWVSIETIAAALPGTEGPRAAAAPESGVLVTGAKTATPSAGAGPTGPAPRQPTPVGRDGAAGALAGRFGPGDTPRSEAGPRSRATAPGGEPTVPPLLQDDRLRRSRHRSWRPRRRWPGIIAATAVAGVSALGLIAAFQTPRPHYTLVTESNGRATAVPAWPAIPDREDKLPVPTSQGGLLSSPDVPPPSEPARALRQQLPAAASPSTVGTKATKAKGTAAPARVAETKPKAPPASRRPASSSAETPRASAGDDTETASGDSAGRPRPVREIIAIGDDFRASGDVALARKYYEAARERGSAKATRALGTTYDPRYVDSRDGANPQAARELYDQAAWDGDRSAADEREDLERWLNEPR